MHLGDIVTRNFEALADARSWIFGDAQKLKTLTMPAIDLKRLAGSAAFELSSAEIAEATAAIRKCRSAGITLHAAVEYAIARMNLGERSKTLREVADIVLAYKQSNGSSPRHLKGNLVPFPAGSVSRGGHETRTHAGRWPGYQSLWWRPVRPNLFNCAARKFPATRSKSLARARRRDAYVESRSSLSWRMVQRTETR